MSNKATIRAALLLTTLAGCANAPVTLGPDSDPRVARELLASAARSGPIRLDVNGLPRAADGALTLPEVAAEAARGIQGMNVRFEPPAAASPGPGSGARLLLLFDPPADVAPRVACIADTVPVPVPQSPARLQALFCDGGTFIADATSTAEGDRLALTRRMIWRTTARLFPDDYASTYGLRQLSWPFGSDDPLKP